MTTINLQTGPSYLGAMHITGAAVTVDGFTINGLDAVDSGVASTNISVAYPAGNVTLKNNRLKIGQAGSGTTGDDGFGIVTYYDETNNITSLTVTDSIFAPLNAEGIRAFYINAGVSLFTLIRNQITGKFTRLAVTRTNSVIENNTITGVGATGSRSGGMATWGNPDPAVYGKASFRNNTFTGVDTGIRILSANDVVVEQNTFHEVGRGVSVEEYDGTFNPATIEIHQNKFLSADTYGVENIMAMIVDATCNWWGAASSLARSGLWFGR